MKSETRLGIDLVLLEYYKSEFDSIEAYFQKLRHSVEDEKTRLISLAEYLESKGAPEDYIADVLDDDSFETSFYEENVYNFAIVFLYSECEKLLKQDYKVLSGSNSQNLFRFDALKKSFGEEGIELSVLTHFSKLNELRCLNNCIKHNGYVDVELSKTNESRWVKDKKIILQYAEIETFLHEARAFFDELVPLIDEKNREKLTIEDVSAISSLC